MLEIGGIGRFPVEQEQRLYPFQVPYDALGTALRVGGMKQGVDIAGSFIGSGVGKKIRWDGIGVEFIPSHDLQKIEHGAAAVTGINEIRHAHPVGGFFLLPAVFQRKCRCRGHSESGNCRSDIPAAPEEGAGQYGRKCREADLLRSIEDLGDVPAVDMGNFMGENPRQFAFILNEGNQPLIDIDITAGRGKGIDRRTPDDREFKFKRCLIAVGENQFAKPS